MASEGRERDRDRDRDRGEWNESVVSIRRCAAVVKGGRRFSFNALVVVGNGRGQVGWGYGKANEVPPAVEKGVKDAHKQMHRVHLRGGTIPHAVIGHFGAAKVLLLLPRPLRDWLYQRIAKNRYTLFGRKDSCDIPSAELRGRLIG